MTHLQLSDAGCCLLGLVPYGDVEPQVYGICPVQRRHHGWLFTVEEPWRLRVVKEMVRSTPHPNGQLRRAVESRLTTAVP